MWQAGEWGEGGVWQSKNLGLPAPLHGSVGIPAVWATMEEAILSPKAHMAWLGGPANGPDNKY